MLCHSTTMRLIHYDTTGSVILHSERHRPSPPWLETRHGYSLTLPFLVPSLLDGVPDKCSDIGKRKKGIQIAKTERKQLLFADGMTIPSKSKKIYNKRLELKRWFWKGVGYEIKIFLQSYFYVQVKTSAKLHFYKIALALAPKERIM